MRSDKIKRIREENLATRQVLCAIFPDTFFPRGAAKRPLKIGIYQDIVALGSDIPKRKLRQALRDYTTGPLYLRAMKAGEPRIDLDGKPAGIVSEEHAAHAQRTLAKINEAMERRKHQRRAAQEVKRIHLAALEGVAA